MVTVTCLKRIMVIKFITYTAVIVHMNVRIFNVGYGPLIRYDYCTGLLVVMQVIISQEPSGCIATVLNEL